MEDKIQTGFLVGKAEGKSPLGISSVGCEGNTEIEWNVVSVSAWFL